MGIRGYHYDRFSGSLGLHCSGYGGGGASINNDIGRGGSVVLTFLLLAAKESNKPRYNK
jgi:hypothetical protein